MGASLTWSGGPPRVSSAPCWAGSLPEGEQGPPIPGFLALRGRKASPQAPRPCHGVLEHPEARAAAVTLNLPVVLLRAWAAP